MNWGGQCIDLLQARKMYTPPIIETHTTTTITTTSNHSLSPCTVEIDDIVTGSGGYF